MGDREPGFLQRTAIRVGVDSTTILGAEMARLGSSRPVVLIDEALADTAVGTMVRAQLPDGKLIAREPGEPTFAGVTRAAEAMVAHQPDGLVAVGGGSTLDTAKVVRGLLASSTDDPSALREEDLGELLPFIAIPTTAGTGAEVGAGAIITNEERHETTLVKIRPLAADIALCDARLTAGLPPSLTAFTGSDAFAQALLSFVSAGEQSVSGQLALRAMRLIHRTLPRAIADGRDLAARADMMLGSVTGAMAMFNAPPTYAGEHAVAEPIGARLGVHHGHLVAALMAPVAELNRDALAAEFHTVAVELGLVERQCPEDEAADAFVTELVAFTKGIGVPGLHTVVGHDYPVSDLVNRCQQSGALSGNPMPVTDQDLRKLLQAAYTGRFTLT